MNGTEHRIRPGRRLHLQRIDANDTGAFRGDKDDARQRIEALTLRLDALQELLYAEHRRALLVILQGMDTAGKDGTIRRVFEGVNPQGVRVAQFRRPSERELDHDFLWRVHAEAPGRGEIVLFNRSHYEDVLITRVHGRIRPEVWRRRFREINEFERMLTDEGTTVLKFFLHIDRNEQARRLRDRLKDRTKHWKFQESDVQERRLWDEYMQAYGETLARTSTAWAPWYLVPSNHRWYRDFVVSDRIVKTLERLHMRYPALPASFRGVRVR